MDTGTRVVQNVARRTRTAMAEREAWFRQIYAHGVYIRQITAGSTFKAKRKSRVLFPWTRYFTTEDSNRHVSVSFTSDLR